MISIISLWLPILLSAVIVFIVSSIIHTLFSYHNTDFSKIPDEGKVMAELRKFNIPPGEYVMPYAGSSKETNTEEYIDKRKRGPVAFITVIKSGQSSMVKELIQWFIYCIGIGILVAYIASRALGVGVSYLSVFRFVGATAFIGYSIALWQNSIWYKRSWSSTLKSTFDGLVYALFTAGIFGWLWPD